MRLHRDVLPVFGPPRIITRKGCTFSLDVVVVDWNCDEAAFTASSTEMEAITTRNGIKAKVTPPQRRLIWEHDEDDIGTKETKYLRFGNSLLIQIHTKIVRRLIDRYLNEKESRTESDAAHNHSITQLKLSAKSNVLVESGRLLQIDKLETTRTA